MKQLILFLFALPLLAVTNSLEIHDTTAGTQTDRPITVARWFEKAEITNYAQPVVDATPAASWQCDAKNRWADGSLKFALVSFPATITGSGSVTVTFQNNTNPCSSGNQAACDAAGLDEAGLLAFNSGTWGAVIEATTEDGDDSTYSPSARTIVDAAFFTYWQRGPIVTTVIAEDNTSARTYDFGWACLTNCTTDFSTATWADDVTYKSLHPVFVLTFYTGWSGVKIEYIVENIWATLLQDQRYTLVLKSDSAASTTEYSHAGRPHYAKTRWRKTFWDGSEPGGIRVDHNLNYLTQAKALLNFDTTLSLPTASADAEAANLQADMDDNVPFYCPDFGSPGTYTCGGYLKNTATAGGRGELGVLERWWVRYFFSMDPGTYSTDLFADVIASAETSGTLPMHLRESGTGLYYDAGDSVDAFGKPFSVDARPTYRTWAGAFGYSYVGTVTGNTGWAVDVEHQSPYCWAAYLVTGDWYFLQEIYEWAAFNTGYSGTGKTTDYERGGTFGYLHGSNMRGHAHQLRAVGHAALFAPDGTAEDNYFEEKLGYNLAVDQGEFGIDDGTYYVGVCDSPYNPSTAGPWCWGNRTVALLWSNNTLQELDFVGGGDTSGLDTSVVAQATSPWMVGYYRLTLLQMSEQHDGTISTAAREIFDHGGPYLVEAMLTSNSTMFSATEYRTPQRRKITNPTLSTGIDSSTLTITPSSIPNEWTIATQPFGVIIDSEKIGICAVGATDLTVCNGQRGTLSTSAAAHSSGASIVSYPAMANWTDWLTGFLSIPTAFHDTGSCEHGYIHILAAGLSGYVGQTFGAYTGQAAWDKVMDQTPDPARDVFDLSCQPSNPRWAIVPREAAAPPASEATGVVSGTVGYQGPIIIE